MKETQHQAESNIGQIIYGDVHATKLVLNIGGQPLALYEIDTRILEGKRTGIEAAIRYRKRLISVPRFITMALIMVLWWIIPQIVQQMKGEPEVIATVAFAMYFASAAASWQIVQMQLGVQQRRNQLTVKHLERVLAQLDAELDMRQPAGAFTIWALFRKLFDARKG